MVDTVRTFTELQDTLFVDGQAAGSITAQDIRDLILTLRQPYGSWTSDGNSTPTPIAVPTTYYDVVLTSVPVNTRDMTIAAAGHLTYNGTVNRHFHVASSISFTCASNNQTVAFALAKNDVILPETRVEVRVGTGADIGSTALHGDAMLAGGDHFSLHVTNMTSTAAVTVTHVYFFAMSMPF